MEDELIKLETAKLAKEKGFNWKVTNYHRVVSGTGQTINNSQPCDMNRIPFDERYTSLPTQSVLQRWLREEYSIHIKIDTTPNFDSTYKSKWRAHLQIPFKPFVRVTGHFYIEDTYEKVLETALKTALNEI